VTFPVAFWHYSTWPTWKFIEWCLFCHAWMQPFHTSSLHKFHPVFTPHHQAACAKWMQVWLKSDFLHFSFNPYSGLCFKQLYICLYYSLLLCSLLCVLLPYRPKGEVLCGAVDQGSEGQCQAGEVSTGCEGDCIMGKMRTGNKSNKSVLWEIWVCRRQKMKRKNVLASGQKHEVLLNQKWVFLYPRQNHNGQVGNPTLAGKRWACELHYQSYYSKYLGCGGWEKEMSSDYTARGWGEKKGGSTREESDRAHAAWSTCTKTRLCAYACALLWLRLSKKCSKLYKKPTCSFSNDHPFLFPSLSCALKLNSQKAFLLLPYLLPSGSTCCFALGSLVPTSTFCLSWCHWLWLSCILD